MSDIPSFTRRYLDVSASTLYEKCAPYALRYVLHFPAEVMNRPPHLWTDFADDQGGYTVCASYRKLLYIFLHYITKLSEYADDINMADRTHSPYCVFTELVMPPVTDSDSDPDPVGYRIHLLINDMEAPDFGNVVLCLIKENKAQVTKAFDIHSQERVFSAVVAGRSRASASGVKGSQQYRIASFIRSSPLFQEYATSLLTIISVDDWAKLCAVYMACFRINGMGPSEIEAALRTEKNEQPTLPHPAVVFTIGNAIANTAGSAPEFVDKKLYGSVWSPARWMQPDVTYSPENDVARAEYQDLVSNDIDADEDNDMGLELNIPSFVNDFRIPPDQESELEPDNMSTNPDGEIDLDDNSSDESVRFPLYGDGIVMCIPSEFTLPNEFLRLPMPQTIFEALDRPGHVAAEELAKQTGRTGVSWADPGAIGPEDLNATHPTWENPSLDEFDAVFSSFEMAAKRIDKARAKVRHALDTALEQHLPDAYEKYCGMMVQVNRQAYKIFRRCWSTQKRHSVYTKKLIQWERMFLRSNNNFGRPKPMRYANLTPFGNFIAELSLQMRSQIHIVRNNHGALFVFFSTKSVYMSFDCEESLSAMFSGRRGGGKSYMMNEVTKATVIEGLWQSFSWSTSKSQGAAQCSQAHQILIEEEVDMDKLGGNQEKTAVFKQIMAGDRIASFLATAFSENGQRSQERRHINVQGVVLMASNIGLHLADEAVLSRLYKDVISDQLDGKSFESPAVLATQAHRHKDTPEFKEFKDHQFKFHFLVAITMQMMNAGYLPRPRMEEAEAIMDTLLERVKARGFPIGDPRARGRMRIMARTILICYAVHMVFFSQQSPFYEGLVDGTHKYSHEDHKHLVPWLYCTEEIAIFTFTFMMREYLNPIMTEVMQQLLKLVVDFGMKHPVNYDKVAAQDVEAHRQAEMRRAVNRATNQMPSMMAFAPDARDAGMLKGYGRSVGGPTGVTDPDDQDDGLQRHRDYYYVEGSLDKVAERVQKKFGLGAPAADDIKRSILDMANLMVKSSDGRMMINGMRVVNQAKTREIWISPKLAELIGFEFDQKSKQFNHVHSVMNMFEEVVQEYFHKTVPQLEYVLGVLDEKYPFVLTTLQMMPRSDKTFRMRNKAMVSDVLRGAINLKRKKAGDDMSQGSENSSSLDVSGILDEIAPNAHEFFEIDQPVDWVSFQRHCRDCGIPEHIIKAKAQIPSESRRIMREKVSPAEEYPCDLVEALDAMQARNQKAKHPTLKPKMELMPFDNDDLF